MIKIVRFTVFVVLALLVVSLPVAAQEDVTISFAHIFGGEQDARGAVVQEIAEAYMAENPGVTIELVTTATDYNELFNSALLAAEQGSAPTIVQVEEGFTQLAADSGYFTPISQLASDEQVASLDDLLGTVRAYYTIGGELYSMPWNASNPVLYYNKGMFEQAGLDPNDPPQTFAEVLTACEAIMAIQADLQIAGCLNFPMVSWFAEQWLAMQNAELVDNDNGRTARATSVYFDSEPMLNIVNWWKQMADAGYYLYSGTVGDYNGEATTFLGKQTAMTINSTAGLTIIQTFSAVQGFELGVAPLPTPSEEATNGVTVGGASLWINAAATPEQQQAAVDFIFYLTSVENDIKWHQGTGYFPVRQRSIEQLTADGWFEANPNFGIAITQLQESAGNIANAGAVIGPAVEVRGILIQGVQSVIDAGEDPAAAMAAAKQRADATIADYNDVVGG